MNFDLEGQLFSFVGINFIPASELTASELSSALEFSLEMLGDLVTCK